MEPQVKAGLIGFLAALAASGLTGYINHYLLMKKAKFDAEQEKLKHEREKQHEQALHIRELKELALKNLNLLSLTLSFSKLDMASSSENSVKYHNENYDQAHTLIAEIMMVVSLHFPKFKSEFKKIEGEANCYWGHFKGYLSSENKDTQSPESNFQKACASSIKCLELIKNLKFDIENT